MKKSELQKENEILSHENKLLKRYDETCMLLVSRFLTIYFSDEEEVDTYAVGGELDGLWEIRDYYISFSDMVTCLKLNIPEETFFSWYDHSLECHVDGKTYANIENYYLMTKETL